MLGKAKLKELFHECKSEIDTKQNLDTLIVKAYQHFNGEISKDDAKEIALCLYYNYGFLYK